MQDFSIPVSFLHAVLRYAPEHGLSADKLLQRCGIPPKILQDETARVSARQYADLQTLAMREMGDEILGYTQPPMKLGTGAALSHWMIHTRNLGQALKRYCHFYGMIERGLKPQLLLTADMAHLRFSLWEDQQQPEPYAFEMVMFGLHRFASWLTRHNLRISQVTLNYPAPEHAREYRAIFLGAPIAFSAEHCELQFRRDLLQKPIRQTQETLDEFLRHPHRNLLLGNYNLQSWIGRTRSILRQNMIEMPTLVDVAESLGTSPKRLRQQLGDEGIRYGELKEQLRRDVAMQHLADSEMSVEQVAFLTGFAESATFIRAFRKWTGYTPHAYRKKYY
ncbi:AraC family transcriptional regulator [Microbulbifer pacificus]|uniref:AraC family transcriptional regulator n=1 Tax=Microbulbifer pacificus TaxID=407164 RepID=A0AAU0MZG2_9GAMM|nr:AraC family transcriptional regulator [Microbulbifer pacificus]WOX05292.1 AraC family transcriptional regulator [Microbulbifer pacificus]